MSDLRPDADVVQMAADLGPAIDEIQALANNRGWTIGPSAQMAAMAAGCLRDALAAHAKERPSRHAALERRGDWIVTRSGKRFWPMDPRHDEFELDDLAHGLAKRDRWNGILNRHYSVGEHSARVGSLARHLAMVEARTRVSEVERAVVLGAAQPYPIDPDLAFAYGVLHDANEALLPDLPRPVKGFVKDWKNIEAAVQKAILEKFALWPVPPEIDRIVTLADDLLLVIESRDEALMPEGPRGEVLYRPEIRDMADEHLTPEAEAEAMAPGSFLLGWEGGRGWLQTAFAGIQTAALAAADARAKAAESAVAGPTGRKEWLNEANRAPTVSSRDFEPPDHLKRLLEGP